MTLSVWIIMMAAVVGAGVCGYLIGMHEGSLAITRLKTENRILQGELTACKLILNSIDEK